MNIPTELTAGDSLQWKEPALAVRGTDYSSAAWTLQFALRGPTKLDLPGAADGSGGWAFALTAAASQGLQAGPYWWQAVLTKGAERVTAGSGQVQVLANLAAITADGFDGRSMAQRALADAEKALADLTGSGQKTKKYAIGPRNAEYFTAAELIEAVNYWRGRVLREKEERAAATGGPNPRNYYVRFTS
ncbi:MAG: hypothetical protein GY734_08285 [Herbaspirillum sp.]|uniref:hypothetical protein n=1 Tax=Herbaspirillum sp. TaxID=1890675 RepID=UPI002588AF55|nr:hypothetical protein [Herbaspirillum sp.]MCP3653334.1 hypothetical protein [Herbaspirillum sp.]MCP3946747.1 hypothetical protein [Herbaspirillum sp.]MCP4031223.1 hypothetical protein [Herbaspirillum sp.]MCP4554368.1 hypothetical protein [Herbaspirillum sp.]